MFKSYEATYDNGQITWLSDEPQLKSARIIITVLEETPTSTKTPKRTTPVHLIGKGKTLGDIVSPIVDEEDWECDVEIKLNVR
ncbi:MAG: hypothetical protein NT070_15650 [Cyanobacteria bacterium]|nr:hypothetical protein [Cyanobacteriota bacterium]